MAFREIKTVLEVNDELEVQVMDNDDILIQWYDTKRNDIDALDIIIAKIQSLEDQITILRTARNLVADTIRGYQMNTADVVSPFYNIIGAGHCVDCDEMEALTISQFGEIEEENLVCISCEKTREFEYGMPPTDAKEQ